MKVRGFDALVKLKVSTELNLRNRNVFEPFGCLDYHAMDLLQVDRLAASITLGNHQILLHMTLIPVSVSVVVQA